jgi:acetyl-CoA C-acetyltransferase
MALSLSAGREVSTSDWDGSYVRNTRIAARKAYEEAGIRDPRKEVSMMEVHDCFSITELVTMEDLFISPEGGAVKDVMDGFFDADGGVPCQIDGGLKCFGHPIGASGLRMAYENYLQLLGRAGPRQLRNPTFGLSHNLGGVPYNCLSAISILGLLN